MTGQTPHSLLMPRRGASRIVRAGGSPKLRRLWDEWEDKIIVRVLFKLGDLWFVEVNGDIIRTWVWIDFTEGGNSNAYAWFPPCMIGCDTDVKAWEQPYTRLHELGEYIRMGWKGMSYDLAHNSINVLEQSSRRSPKLLTPFWNKQVADYIRLYKTMQLDITLRQHPLTPHSNWLVQRGLV